MSILGHICLSDVALAEPPPNCIGHSHDRFLYDPGAAPNQGVHGRMHEVSNQFVAARMPIGIVRLFGLQLVKSLDELLPMIFVDESI